LFIWQLSFSAPLSIASGCIGLAGYAAYYWPHLETVYAAHTAAAHIPWAGPLQVSWIVTPGTALAIAICCLTVFLLYRRITVISRLSTALWVVVMATMGWIIFAGLTHFNAARAFDFPPGAFTLSPAFFTGLGGAMLVATYDYWGYYNVCYIGDEIKDPTKNIPRALLLSILFVACLYLMMNLCILAVVPWREMLEAGRNNSGLYVVSLFMQKVYGAWAARLVTGLVIVTAFASVFSLTLGYSRVPYAAALDGNYFRVFAKVHPVYRFPHVSLLALGVVAAAFCFLRLKDAIAALVVIRLVLQFLVQAVGLIVFRITHPEAPRPFRMWLYPLPALVAIAGFLFILFNRVNWQKEVRYAAVILIVGLAIYFVRAWRGREWPFGIAESSG
jgi:basic amino acid/polyamine antiporter, APA family